MLWHVLNIAGIKVRRTPTPPLSHRESMRWASWGQKIPSFRAVLPIATEPQRLSKTPKSVSDRLLSLFTRTSLQKVRSEKVEVFCAFRARRWQNLLDTLLDGGSRENPEVDVVQ